jgi:hypothetical protein
MSQYQFIQGDKEVTRTFSIPDWDWGEVGNTKLRQLFDIPEDKPMHDNARLDFFLNYLLQEIDVDCLVGFYLRHAPLKELKGEAEAIGCYEFEAYETGEEA